MQTVALALCAAGLAVLIYPLTRDRDSARHPAWRSAPAMSWAAGTVYLKWARIDADPMGVASWQVTIASSSSAACMLVFEGRLDLGARACRRRCSPRSSPACSATASPMVCGSRSSGGCRRRRPRSACSAVPVIGVVASMLILGEVPDRRRHRRLRLDLRRFRLRAARRPRHAPPRREPLRTRYALILLRQFGDARDHRALRVGERVDDGEMVGAGDLLVARLRRASAKPAR